MSKLSYDEKIQLYQDRKNGMSKLSLSKKYNICIHGIQYLCCLIDIHGYDILRASSNKCYSKFIKQNAIDRVLNNNESIWSVSLDIGLPGDGMLHNWIKKYKENGYNIVEQKRGRPTMNKVTKKKIRRRKWIFESRAKILKKIESRCSSKEESTTEEKVTVVSELRLKYDLKILLKISDLARSTYYYTLSKTNKDDKNKEIIEKIKENIHHIKGQLVKLLII